MTMMNINRKQSQGNHWQDTLQDYKARMTKQDAPESDKSTSAHKVKPGSGKTPQKPTSETQQAKQQPAQERVRPQGMTRRQWKNVKNMRRALAFWPELFDLDNPKPLKVGIIDDLMQDISARNLTIGAGVLKATLARYTHRIRYQKALAAGGVRHDLYGEPCGEVTKTAIKHATERFKALEQKLKAGRNRANNSDSKPEAESATDGR
ncbi:proQ/FINO family protein [Salmonella enterica subsp. enterica serovar Infantis]|uniref:ProQ/FINO family protein n=1 Tax=Salmonella enterica TaxID=28901 RepID=A0A743XFW1_SALER|nr:proQ/FINO family protein [Salmonella enterica subsp. enterica serovar Infantis]EEJ6509994.1 proQ/FINO family protein [Salmonella enterica subsp. enterica]HAF2325086.1 proQ/FINO family protein [Salmonella enterica]ECY4978135.1 proQ/FINO family protein [Salmonella enterica subsp. enterica serovar Infantis]EDH9411137.1 proQ/FINO family protein [Salmonella enterica subsp. enterica serovar Infantis]